MGKLAAVITSSFLVLATVQSEEKNVTTERIKFRTRKVQQNQDVEDLGRTYGKNKGKNKNKNQKNKFNPELGGAFPPDSSYQCAVGTPGCCPTMIPPSFLAPDDSTCWQWWDPPANGVLPPGTVPPKGCDYKPCQDAVCACDDYCCTTAWDLSCRGYALAPGDSVENNYFVNGCSARILCCEQESAYPDPPVGGAGGGGISVGQTDIDVTVTQTTGTSTTSTSTYIIATGYGTKGGKKGSYDPSMYGGKKGGSYGGALIYTGVGKGGGKGARRNRRRQ